MLIRSDHDHHHLTKVNQNSHFIKKPSSPPLTPTSKTHHRQPPPVIIYAHAPRVIHTKPQEFKALVQTLTGFTQDKNTTKNDHPPAQPPTPHLPPPNKLPMYYDFEEFETKNVVPLTNNSAFSIIDELKQHNILMMDDNMNMSCLSGGGGEFFAPPIFDPPIEQQTNITSLPFFAPKYGDQQLCCTTNNNFANNDSVGFIGTVSNKINTHSINNNMFYNQHFVDDIGNENGSGCYYSDGVSSSSIELSSVEEAIDELTDFC